MDEMNEPNLAGNQTQPRSRSRIPAPLRVVIGLIVFVIAMTVFVRFIRYNPESLFERAMDVIESNPTRAEKLLKQSIDASGGNFPHAQMVRSGLLGSMDRWDDATICFQGIADPTTTCPPVDLVGLVQQAEKTKKYEYADMVLETIQLPGKDQGLVYQMWIPIRINMGSLDGAMKLCEAYKTLDPDDPIPWFASASVHVQRLEVKPAIAAYRKAIKRSPSKDGVQDARMQIAQLSLEIGDIAAARHEADLLMDQPKPSEEIQLLHAEVLHTEGKFKESLAAAGKVLTKSPMSVPALLCQGACHFDTGDFQKAVDSFGRVILLDRYHRHGHYKLGQSYLRLKQKVKAQEHLDWSQQLTEMAAQIIETKNQLAKDPENIKLKTQLLQLYENTGQQDAAKPLRNSLKSK